MTFQSTYDNAMRGYGFAYRIGEENRCPGCGNSNWYIGRLSAECAFCAVTLPFGAARPNHAHERQAA